MRHCDMFLVLKVGACADLLQADGNLPKDLSGVTGVNNLKIVMKGGKIDKNML